MDDHLRTEQLYSYLDGELEEAEQFKLERHLNQCSHCQHRLRRVDGLFSAIGSVPEESLSRDLAPVVVAELAGANKELARLPLWLAAQGLVAAGVVAAWLLLQPSRLGLARGLFDQIDLLFWWSQWALPRVGDLQLALADLPDQFAELTPSIDLTLYWASASTLPWTPIIAGLLVLWLLSNGVLLGSGLAGNGRWFTRRAGKDGNHG